MPETKETYQPLTFDAIKCACQNDRVGNTENAVRSRRKAKFRQKNKKNVLRLNNIFKNRLV